MEILAPCGGTESFTAAINAGTDAVYLGLNKFSARGNATNFTFDELESVIRQSRLYGVKLYLALNTLIFDDELTLLREYIGQAVEMGIDAVIVQDLGVASIVKRISPHTRLHASTQMTTTTVEGANALQKLGFTRVVLARELSREEIRGICNKSSIETEVFVHGAHCVSVSGQCYMSSILGGSIYRSGNRGMCAQPCRLDFCERDKNVHYALSLKDLSLIRHIGELKEMGVTSIKIEGRMKRPEYVAATVEAFRATLDGLNPDIDLLGRVFSRGGFTDGYFTGNCSNANMLGSRTKEDVTATAEAIREIKARSLKSPYKRYTVYFNLIIKENKPTKCIVRTNDISVTVIGAVPEKALNKSTTEDFIKAQMLKLGGTIFLAGGIECDIEPGLMLKTSQINGIRREALQKLSDEIIKIKEHYDKSP
ncbi:MAG: U32 family peptidase [Oscillospiraceae bacterium]|nr:U32 family peptidase [Oscillospiraceae bacterium]